MQATTLVSLLLAPVIGSFLGVLIRRLPRGAGIVFGRSRCEACGQPIAAGDMVPLLSFLLLRGRCRQCRDPIARVHIQIELAALGIATAALLVEYLAAGDSERVWADCVLGWGLLTLGWIDAEHMILPDVITLPLIVLGLAWTFYADPTAIEAHAVAALAGYLGFRTVAFIYRRMRGIDGLGEGDAKLLAAGGAWVGLGGLGPVILAAGLFGVVFAAIVAWRGRTIGLRTRIPFGPCLAAAIWIVFLIG